MKTHQQDEVLDKLQRIESLLKDKKHKPLTLVETADYLSISQSHLYKLTSQRKIPHHKPNGKYLYFFKEELDEWITSSEKAKEKSENVETDASTPLSMNEDEEEPP